MAKTNQAGVGRIRIISKLIQVHDLPTLPEVVQRILQIIEDERSSASDLTALLEYDCAISARVLRLANSPFYGLRNTVASIRKAVVVLGFDAVRHLALAASVFDVFAKRRQFALEPVDFWMHSFGAAKAAQVLHRATQCAGSPESSFTAALLHDIGKFLLALVLKDEYYSIVQEAENVRGNLKDVETTALGLNHADIGQWATSKWQFPPAIVEAVGNQYNAAYTGSHRSTAAIVAAADTVSRCANFGSAGDHGEPRIASHFLKTLRTTQEKVDAIVSELAGIRGDARQFLDLLGSD